MSLAACYIPVYTYTSNAKTYWAAIWGSYGAPALALCALTHSCSSLAAFKNFLFLKCLSACRFLCNKFNTCAASFFWAWEANWSFCFAIYRTYATHMFSLIHKWSEPYRRIFPSHSITALWVVRFGSNVKRTPTGMIERNCLWVHVIKCLHDCMV